MLNKTNKTLLIITAFIVVNSSVFAQEPLSLKSSNTSEIYVTQIGGLPQEGILTRMELILPEYKSAVMFAAPRGFDAINQLQPWYSTDISKMFDNNHNLTDVHVLTTPGNTIFFGAFALANGGYMVIQPISALQVTSWLEVKDKNRVNIVTGTLGTDQVAMSNAPTFVYAVDKDLYKALATVWSIIFETEQVKGRTTWRTDKEYPEPFKYLGWCSWEQYRKNIYESLLVDAVQQIEDSPIPIRWVLIDDGHQTKAHNSGELASFEVNKSRFPNGWGPVLDKRSDKVKWFGLWHSMFGEWGGINVNHTMDDLQGHLIPHSKNSMIVAQTQEASDLFFNKLVNSVADPGFDFAKIDIQTRDFANYIGKGNPVIAHRQNAESMEAATSQKLNGLINCMAQNLPCIFNTRNSVVTRVSVDYKLNNIPLAISHIYQSYHNSLWMGQTTWPDHDMFHSSDEKLGRLMAVSKAMSGAPIYLSDAPKDMLEQLVIPLVYDDGELLRVEAPGVPLPCSFFSDALFGKDVYSVIAPTSSSSAAIVVYNISSNYINDLQCVVQPTDYQYANALIQPYPGLRAIPKEGLVYYDWYEKEGGRLDSEFSFTLDTLRDKLVLLGEIDNGWSVIGLEDKYLSGATVKSVKSSDKSIHISMYQAGTVIVYSNKALKNSSAGTIEPLTGGLYRIIDAPKEFELYR